MKTFREMFIEQVENSACLELVGVGDTLVSVLNIDDDFTMTYVFDKSGNLVNSY